MYTKKQFSSMQFISCIGEIITREEIKNHKVIGINVVNSKLFPCSRLRWFFVLDDKYTFTASLSVMEVLMGKKIEFYVYN